MSTRTRLALIAVVALASPPGPLVGQEDACFGFPESVGSLNFDGGDESEEAAKSKNGKKPSRYIPADEKRKVIEAFGDRCWVDGCNDDVFVDFSHRRAYRHRGKNGARNLRRFCRRHHQLIDSGTIMIVKGARGALLVDRTGNCVGKLRGPPP